MLLNQMIFSIFLLLFGSVNGDHFRGGIISWRPLNNRPNSSSVAVQIHQRYFWDRLWGSFSTPCTEANVVAKTQIPVSNTVICAVNCSSSPGFPSISTIMTTTDCNPNPLVRSWAGERYTTVTLPLTTSVTFYYYSNAWFITNLYLASGLYWTLANRMNLALRPDGYVNTSPVTNTLPVLFKPVGQQLVHVIQMADNDGTDILKCRWSNANATTNYNRVNECQGACMGLNGFATLNGNNCTLVFTLPIARAGWYFVIALQIEDYYDSSSMAPMSSVPIQFLFYAYTPSGSCTTRPEIIGERPNRACIATQVNETVTERVVAQSFCSGANISNFVTSSPYGMQHSAIVDQGGGIYVMTLTWTPDDKQYGPQGFCAGAVDSNNLQSDAWCITYLVGFESPDLIRTQTVQGSASPVGTILSNHTHFSIQATRSVNRPTRNGTYIRFMDASTNTSVQVFDAGWQPNIVYTGNTIMIITNYTWTPGGNYYVLFDSGVASGIEFCGPESAPITDANFWPFNIWDPGVSSTTTTTTLAPTTGSITTRPVLISSVNTLLTTTGIVLTTPITFTTTTTELITTTTTIITITQTIATNPLSNLSIIDPKAFEEACKPSVIAMTIAGSIVAFSMHTIGMFALYIKVNKSFNPNHITPLVRNQQRIKGRQLKK